MRLKPGSVLVDATSFDSKLLSSFDDLDESVKLLVRDTYWVHEEELKEARGLRILVRVKVPEVAEHLRDLLSGKVVDLTLSKGQVNSLWELWVFCDLSMVFLMCGRVEIVHSTRTELIQHHLVQVDQAVSQVERQIFELGSLFLGLLDLCVLILHVASFLIHLHFADLIHFLEFENLGESHTCHMSIVSCLMVMAQHAGPFIVDAPVFYIK